MSDDVPNAPPLYLHVVYQALGFTAFTLALVPVLLFRAVLHIFPKARPYPTWSLRRDLAVAGGRLYLRCTSYSSLPRPHGRGAWESDPLVEKAAGNGTGVKVVEVPPLEPEWIIGIAKTGEGIVKPESVACFWTWDKKGAAVKGDEDALGNERVIFYVAGG